VNRDPNLQPSQSSSRDETNLEGFVLNPSFDTSGKMEIFENKSLKVYIYKATHQRQKNFRLLDQMYHIKIEQKNKNQSILLRDLLELFDKIFKYILSHVKTLFNLDDHNIAYLTLYQTPFVNGLNTGKYLTFLFPILL